MRTHIYQKDQHFKAAPIGPETSAFELKAHLTQFPGEHGRALAHKAVQNAVAAPTVLAGPTGTPVPLDLAVRAHKAWRALTEVPPGPFLKGDGGKIDISDIDLTHENPIGQGMTC